MACMLKGRNTYESSGKKSSKMSSRNSKVHIWNKELKKELLS